MTPIIRESPGRRVVIHRPDLDAPLIFPAASSPVVDHPAIPATTKLTTKARRLRRELATWLRAGAPLAPRAIRRERLAICSACAYYAPAGNLGLGECKFPGCGCTRVKLALATSRCPQTPPRWPAYQPDVV
jgi:hypothetical protein